MANSQRGKRVQLGPVKEGFMVSVRTRSGMVSVQLEDTIGPHRAIIDLNKDEARNLLEWLKEELVD